MKLYDIDLSGNCHKVRLFLSLLGIEYEQVAVDYLQGEHKSQQFLQLNPLGQVPVLVDGDVVVRDSQAILVYLARQYEAENWLPLEPVSMAKIMQWLSFAANEINNSLFIARLHFLFHMDVDWEQGQTKGKQVLQLLNEHLEQRQWLELDHPTIADLACFPYVGLAPEGKVSLEPYPNVVAWIERIQNLPNYVRMPGL
jgi:glutathione S-transferase